MSWNASIQPRIDVLQHAPLFAFGRGGPIAGFTNTATWLSWQEAFVPGGITAGAATRPFLVKVGTVGRVLEPREGKMTISNLRAEVLARDDHVLDKLVATEKASGATATKRSMALYMGFRDLSLLTTHWQRIFLGRAFDYLQTKDGLSWEIVVQNPLERMLAEVNTKADGTELLLNSDLDAGALANWSAVTSGTSTITEEDTPSLVRTEDGSAAKFSFDGSGSKASLEQSVTGFAGNEYLSFEFWARGDSGSLPFEIGVKNTTSGNWMSADATGNADASSTWQVSEIYLPAVPGNGVYARTIVRIKMEAGGGDLKFYIRGRDVTLANATVYSELNAISFSRASLRLSEFLLDGNRSFGEAIWYILSSLAWIVLSFTVVLLRLRRWVKH